LLTFGLASHWPAICIPWWGLLNTALGFIAGRDGRVSGNVRIIFLPGREIGE
jgi:hypothetical protein